MGSDNRRSAGRPTKLEAEALSKSILDNARQMFARKGIPNSSLEEIAKALAISKHTLYRRYQNKQALLEAVVERDLRRFRAALMEASESSPDPMTALHSVALRYFHFGADRDYSAFYLSVVAEATISETLRKSLADWSLTALEPLRQAIGAAQSAEAIVPGDPTEICEVLVDLIEGTNNRMRLSVGNRLDNVELLAQFERRWSIFITSMSRRAC